MYSRLLTKPNQSFFLLGPRGTGKTTWIKDNLQDAVYLDLLDAGVFNTLTAHPNRLERYIPIGFKGWVVIDEVQRIPELLNEAHRLIESRGIRFALTGSSARKLRRRGVNLLAGRALTYRMYPLTAGEMKGDFSLERALKYGLLPMACSAADPRKFLESYVQTYLKEEVREEGLTRNLSSFGRFLESASFSQGGVLNISQVARECGVERKTVEGYFGVLEDLLIAYRVPVFRKKAKRRMVSHPKFFLFDVGVYRAIRPSGPLDRPEEIEGGALETLVFQELIAMNEYLEAGYSIYFWRTANQIEVDFVLYGERGLIAIEATRAATLRRVDFSGLTMFKKDYPTARAIMLYGGERVMSEKESIEVVPIDEFFENSAKFLT